MEAQPWRGAHDGAYAAAARASGSARPFLIGRLGDRPIAVPLAAVDRVLRMAALTPLSELARGIAGVLNLHGEILPVVDPRGVLGLPAAPPEPDQHLVVLSARTRYILWLDRAERVVDAPAQDTVGIDTGAARAYVPHVLRLEGEVVPVLSPEALDPGPIVRQNEGPAA
jgi:purine-binding chemotaxis protein CheW